MSCLFFNNIYAHTDSLDESSIKAIGAILIDAKSGRVLWGKNIHKQLAMASTTKIMTAIVALENSSLEDVVTVTKDVVSVPKVKMNLVPNEKLKLSNLLYALMLESANDAAVAIADHISGNVDSFCSLMTKRAKEIGALDTVFKTPNGLDKPEHHSTAYDMAIIARYALNNPQFIKIINTPCISFSSNKKSYYLNNKNRLLREYDGANGVKTGFTGKAGHCFVGSAKRNDEQFISVVLGSGWGSEGKENKWSDTKKILNYGFDNFEYKTIFSKGDIATNIEVKHARQNNIDLAYESDFVIPVKTNDREEVNIKLIYPDNLEAPIIKHDIYGKAQILINGKAYSEINLVAYDSIDRHDFISSLKKTIDHWLKITTKTMLTP
jgi:D-alanyl-D-alanine carboxypeptidase (penicillin-binding protein 5/6)